LQRKTGLADSNNSSFGFTETWELTGVIAVGGGVKGELTVKLVSFAPDFS